MLPMVQETRMLFSRPPYLFQDFVGKALALLGSGPVRDLGFVYDPKTALPCKWKCSDESLFGVDLCLYAYTGAYPFDKGQIGGFFNRGSVGAAVHHAPTNLDFGGSHVGFQPRPDGGRFGRIERPLHPGEHSTDCGYLCGLLAPFQETYRDACENILLWAPAGHVLVSIPNEYLQPSWSSGPIKLLVDLENLTAGPIGYQADQAHTHKLAGRSLFIANPTMLARQPEADRARFSGAKPAPIGPRLTAELFHTFDTGAALGPDGTPLVRLLPYMKHILAAVDASAELKAAVISANIESNRLADTIRSAPYRPYAFASFTGVFLDVYDPVSAAYVNLFQPVGLVIKPAGASRETEFPVAEIHELLAGLEPARPVHPLDQVLGFSRPAHLLEQFDFRPGQASAHPKT
jgi:hypothetical protein